MAAKLPMAWNFIAFATSGHVAVVATLVFAIARRQEMGSGCPRGGRLSHGSGGRTGWK